MGTSFYFTRTTAIIIFLAFAFRLGFVNVYQFTSFEASKTKHLVAAHFSSVIKKRRRCAEEVTSPTFESYSSTEVCEDDSDREDDLIKANSPSVTIFLYSFVKRITNSLVSSNPFDAIKCNLFPKKYLAFSILRI